MPSGTIVPMPPSVSPEQPSSSASVPASFFRFGWEEWSLLLLCLFLFFWRLGGAPLFDLDEALYVGGAKQMIVMGDIVTPRLNARPAWNPDLTNVPFYEKPILVYWLPAASMRLFGIHEFAARLPVALASLLTTGLVVLAGRRWFGRRAGLLAGLVYATAPLTVLDARQMTTDGLLVLWFTLAMLAFWQCRKSGNEEEIRKFGNQAISQFPPLLFWTVCALAALTKGLVGLLLPLVVIVVYLTLDRVVLWVRCRRWNGWSVRSGLRLHRPREVWQGLGRLRPVIGLLLFLLLTIPWHYLVWKAGGQDSNGRTWVQEYVIRQHVGRFQGMDKVHNAPLPSYFAFFLVGFFPWACFAPAAFRARTEDPPVYRFLLVWFWTIFLFFTAGAAKLPTYIAPAYPAAALLVGRWLDGLLAVPVLPPSTARSLRRGALGALITALLLVIAAVLAPRFTPASSPMSPAMAQLALHLTLLLLVGTAAAWYCFHRGVSDVGWRRGGIACGAGMLAALIGVGCTEGYALARREVMDPFQQAAVAARAEARSGCPVLYYHIVPRRPSMNFYADTYTPYETKETPFLPYLRRLLSPARPQAAVIASEPVWRTILKPELDAAPDVSVEHLPIPEEGAGGWLLLRLTLRSDQP